MNFAVCDRSATNGLQWLRNPLLDVLLAAGIVVNLIVFAWGKFVVVVAGVAKTNLAEEGPSIYDVQATER